VPTFSKTLLSGSTNGASTLVSASATPGTVIHTAQSGTSGLDEVWLYADNSSTSAVKLTIEFGGTAEKDQIEISIAGESGLILVVPGLVLNNSLVTRAFAGTANVISISGYVNRIS
jgi:hypothetical protein